MMCRSQNGLEAGVTSVLIGCLLLAFSTPLFPQCSTAAWTSETGTPLPLGESSIPPGAKYEQDCGLTVDLASELPSYVTTDDPVDEPQVTLRFYFLADLLEITSEDGDVTLLRARDGATPQFEIRLRSTGIVKHLVAVYWDNGVPVEHPGPLEVQDVWHAVEVGWSAGAGDGTFSLKLDKIPRYAVTDLDNGGEVVNQVDLGVINTPSATGELAFDAFMLRRTGQPGVLTINELRNISTRARVGTVHDIIIGGFIIAGNTDKCLIIRGRGPSINVQGEVSLSNPLLELKLGASTIASNDDWIALPQADIDIITSLGLQPFNNLEAAIYTCIPPGGYTVFLRGKNNLTGIGIIEVLDADLGTPFLRNISTRSHVGTVNLVAIAGFIIEGDQQKQVLIRGRGPTVSVPDGVTRLPNPRVRLFSGNVVIAANDNWGTAPNAADITATGKAPSDPLESAILISLDPGAYTAIVDGVGGGGTTGIGIVEVFDQSGGSIAAQ